MVKLHYGKKTIEIKNDKFLSIEDQRNLLDGKFVVETSIGSDKSNKIRKTYYVGVLYDIFHANYHPEFSKKEIYAMMVEAYPLFINSRQIENTLFEYFTLKEKYDVFTID